MASLFSTTPTLTCASKNTIPKLSKSLSSSRCPNLIGPVIVLDASSSFLANALRNTPLVVCFSHVVSRAYVGDDSENTPEADDDDYGGPDSEVERDEVEIEIEKPGKNSRMIRSKVAMRASLETVWDILTDYERLADFIPGLAVSQLVEKRENFARLFQIGEQDLAFGVKFNAKGTIDCFEKDLETLPFGQKRDIEFKMVEGDFQLFEGRWSVEQSPSDLYGSFHNS